MRILALDCGTTKTRALLIEDGQLISEALLPAVNAQLHGPAAVAELVFATQRQFPEAQACTGAVAGLRTNEDRESVLNSLRQLGYSLPLMLFSDGAAALRAGGRQSGVVLIAGTGSAAYARGTDGSEARAGGWGHRIGDEGSGYWIGREALSAVARARDSGRTSCSRLEQEVLAHFGVTQLDGLRGVTTRPDAVAEIAALVPTLARLYQENDPVVRDIVQRAAIELARLVRIGVARAPMPSPRPVVLAGGVFRSLTELKVLIATELGSNFDLSVLTVDPAWGAYWLAVESGSWMYPIAAAILPATERENPASARFAQLTTLDQARYMNHEDGRVPLAVARALPEIVRLIEAAATRQVSGGRLIYVGAGTSGRLAMLDAVECVPTFGIPPGRVIAMIAGGRDALERAVEGAEDDEQAGEADVRMLGLSARDVVVGVTASGQARYVQGALGAAQASGCLTGVVVCNGAAPVCEMAEIAVVVEPGPEVIAGSTRLKAGTAQKLVLNMISTLIMVRLGRTMGNKMIGVRPTNAKLRARSIRLVRDLTSSSEEEAETALIYADWDVALATLSLHLGSAHAAQHALAESGMNIAEAMARAGLRPT